MSSHLYRKRALGGLLGLAALAVWNPSSWADAPGVAAVQESVSTARVSLELEQAAPACVPKEQCCKVCSKGKACGNTCIRADYNCHKGPGCACDSDNVCD
jgi:hypothetical protein